MKFSKEQIRDFKFFTKTNPDAVNRKEFVKKGSVSKRKVYISGDTVTFTLDNEQISNTRTMSLDLNHPESLTFKSYGQDPYPNIKDYNSK